MRGAIDFEEIAKSVRQYIPPSEGMGSPYSIDARDAEFGPNALTGLIEGIQKRSYNPDKCAFYMHPVNHNRIINHKSMQHTALVGADSFRGRPVRTHPTVPKDCILFMAPDAVSLGGKVYNPEMIAYADISNPD